MTKEEFIAQRFATKLKLLAQDEVIDDIKHTHEGQLKAKLEQPKELYEALSSADTLEHATLSQQYLAEHAPFKRYDFVVCGTSYYEVQQVSIDLNRLGNMWANERVKTITAPPKNWLNIRVRCFEIRKSGTLAKYTSNFDFDSDRPSLRKVDMAEDLRLRRAVKQRMRRRLEGGD